MYLSAAAKIIKRWSLRFELLRALKQHINHRVVSQQGKSVKEAINNSKKK